jgi:hypothetical protein
MKLNIRRLQMVVAGAALIAGGDAGPARPPGEALDRVV